MSPFSILIEEMYGRYMFFEVVHFYGRCAPKTQISTRSGAKKLLRVHILH